MADQLDPAAGVVLAAALDDLGVRRAHRRPRVAEVIGAYGELVAVRLTDGSVLCHRPVLVSLRYPARDRARRRRRAPVGRGVGRRRPGQPGGPAVHAIGDCAEPPTGCTGLVAPGWEQARGWPACSPAATRCRLVAATVDDLPEGVRLKAAGVDLVTRGRAAAPRRCARRPGASRSRTRGPAGTSRSSYGATGSSGVTCARRPAASRRRSRSPSTGVRPLPVDPARCCSRRPAAAERGDREASPTLIPADATVCRCNGVTKSDLIAAPGTTAAAPSRRSRRAPGRPPAAAAAPRRVCGLVDWLTTSDAGDREHGSTCS